MPYFNSTEFKAAEDAYQQGEASLQQEDPTAARNHFSFSLQQYRQAILALRESEMGEGEKAHASLDNAWSQACVIGKLLLIEKETASPSSIKINQLVSQLEEQFELARKHIKKCKTCDTIDVGRGERRTGEDIADEFAGKMKSLESAPILKFADILTLRIAYLKSTTPLLIESGISDQQNKWLELQEALGDEYSRLADEKKNEWKKLSLFNQSNLIKKFKLEQQCFLENAVKTVEELLNLHIIFKKHIFIELHLTQLRNLDELYKLTDDNIYKQKIKDYLQKYDLYTIISTSLTPHNRRELLSYLQAFPKEDDSIILPEIEIKKTTVGAKGSKRNFDAVLSPEPDSILNKITKISENKNALTGNEYSFLFSASQQKILVTNLMKILKEAKYKSLLMSNIMHFIGEFLLTYKNPSLTKSEAGFTLADTAFLYAIKFSPDHPNAIKAREEISKMHPQFKEAQIHNQESFESTKDQQETLTDYKFILQAFMRNIQSELTAHKYNSLTSRDFFKAFGNNIEERVNKYLQRMKEMNKESGVSSVSFRL